MTEILTMNPGFSFRNRGRIWRSAQDSVPFVMKNDGEKIPFSAAKSETTPYITGVGRGFRTIYREFPGLEELVLECRTWVEESTGDVIFEMVPLNDAPIQEIDWPEAFENPDDNSYTVLPLMQGELVPNHTRQRLENDWPIIPDYYEYRWSCSRSMYMQFFGQYDPEGACMTIFETRYDGGMTIASGEGRDVTVTPRWRECLGKIGYTRRLRVRFFPAGADYNEMCKAYRAYIRSIGELVTLKQKIAANPKLGEMIGRPLLHTYIWYHIQPDSKLFDPAHPEHNDRMQSFAEVGEQIRSLAARGIDHAVLHLDGWGHRGYDNQHPDYLPPAEKPGGWQGMKELADTCHELGWFFGTHDQYRDYFYDADSFDESMAVHNGDGSVSSHAIWNGGKQTFLCATLAPYYVHRNFAELKEHGIMLDNTYLDVFSCVELDECFSPEHPMTREQCAKARMRCFNDCAADGILVQSEEGIDWALPGLDFVHHAPFRPWTEEDREEPRACKLPLLELVYHDCLITPWSSERAARKEDPRSEKSLFGLLCGGMSYIPADATDEEIARCLQASAWHKQVACREMLRHEFVDGDPKHQRVFYEGGWSAEVNLRTGEYQLHQPE